MKALILFLLVFTFPTTLAYKWKSCKSVPFSTQEGEVKGEDGKPVKMTVTFSTYVCEIQRDDNRLDWEWLTGESN